MLRKTTILRILAPVFGFYICKHIFALLILVTSLQNLLCIWRLLLCSFIVFSCVIRNSRSKLHNLKWKKHANLLICIRFEVLTAVAMKSPIYYAITLCCPLKINQRFGRACLHVQGQAKQEASVKKVPSRAMVHVPFFFSLFFDSYDGGYIILRNVGWLSADYTAL
jgi:hypothetical protein